MIPSIELLRAYVANPTDARLALQASVALARTEPADWIAALDVVAKARQVRAVGGAAGEYLDAAIVAFDAQVGELGQ